MSVRELTGVKKQIYDHLKNVEKTNLRWLAFKLDDMNYNTLYWYFCTNESDLPDDKLEKINLILGTSFQK